MRPMAPGPKMATNCPGSMASFFTPYMAQANGSMNAPAA